MDEAIDAVIVRPLVGISDAFLYRSVDAAAIDDTGVNGTGRAVRAIAADVFRYLHSGLAQSYLFFMALGSALVVGLLLR